MKTRTVLIVDDDKVIREQLEKELKRDFVSTLLAADGKTALEIISKHNVDILILDVKLPDMDGLEVLWKVKEGHPDCEVIVVADADTRESAVHSLRRGAIDYITKPLNMEDLFVALGRAQAKLSRKEGLAYENTILVIDDEELIVKRLKKYLEKEGFVVFIASNGKEGLSILRNSKIDVLITDIRMGDMDGIEVIQQAKNLYRDIEGIVVTGYKDQELTLRSLRAGAIDYITKPINLDELLFSIKKATDKINLRRNSVYRNRELKNSKEIISKMNEELERKIEERSQELSQAQAQLMQSDKMASIGQLAAGVAHEINNPMGFIYSNLESARSFYAVIQELIEKYSQTTPLLEAGGSPDCKKLLEEIREFRENKNLDLIMDEFKDLIEESLDGAERVRKIVKDLKSFSHVDNEEWEYADINENLESTLNIAWNEIKYKAEVNKDYGDLPELKCNGMQLNQAFLNILVNAAQAIEEKGTISIKTCAENGGISVEISDSGEGMSKETQSRLFEPFYTTKEVGKGTGLGLSMVYDIIKKHKGTITVESEIGKGTTFVITIPVSET
jgi:signal transduction histidine kinase